MDLLFIWAGALVLGLLGGLLSPRKQTTARYACETTVTENEYDDRSRLVKTTVTVTPKA